MIVNCAVADSGTGWILYVPPVGRGGFEPDPDVLAHFGRCARLAGFESFTNSFRRHGPLTPFAVAVSAEMGWGG